MSLEENVLADFYLSWDMDKNRDFHERYLNLVPRLADLIKSAPKSGYGIPASPAPNAQIAPLTQALASAPLPPAMKRAVVWRIDANGDLLHPEGLPHQARWILFQGVGKPDEFTFSRTRGLVPEYVRIFTSTVEDPDDDTTALFGPATVSVDATLPAPDQSSRPAIATVADRASPGWWTFGAWIVFIIGFVSAVGAGILAYSNGNTVSMAYDLMRGLDVEDPDIDAAERERLNAIARAQAAVDQLSGEEEEVSDKVANFRNSLQAVAKVSHQFESEPIDRLLSKWQAMSDGWASPVTESDISVMPELNMLKTNLVTGAALDDALKQAQVVPQTGVDAPGYGNVSEAFKSYAHQIEAINSDIENLLTDPRVVLANARAEYDAAKEHEDNAPLTPSENMERLLLKRCSDADVMWRRGDGGQKIGSVCGQTPPAKATPAGTSETDGALAPLTQASLPGLVTQCATEDIPSGNSSAFCRQAWHASRTATMKAQSGWFTSILPNQIINPFSKTGSVDVPVLLCLAIAGLTLVFIAIGAGKKRVIFGCLINNQNRLSLARTQVSMWTILVLAGFGIVAFFNGGLVMGIYREALVPGGFIAANDEVALIPTIPAPLFLALGIAIASPMLSAVILGNKKAVEDSKLTLAPQSGASQSTGGIARFGGQGTSGLAAKRDPKEASLLDLIQGEERANANAIDLSRVQNAIITIVLGGMYFAVLLDFCSDIAPRILFEAFKDTSGVLTSLPDPGASFTALLALSHAAYLVVKGTPQAGSA